MMEDKLHSRTLWIGISLIILSTWLLVNDHITDVIWGSTISMVFGAIAAKSVGEKFAARGQ